MIEILEPGPLTTVQDLGRAGYAHLAVPRSGAFDRRAHRQANRLVGNADTAAALEVTLGGLSFRLSAAATIAGTGARCPGSLDWGVAVSVPAGRDVRLGVPATGLRSYVAIRGGIAVEPMLGSRSYDTLSGLGPPRLRPGDRLPLGQPDGPVSEAIVAGARPGAAVLAARLGPRDDWFAPDARRLLFGTAWTVRADSDRVGLRLDGPRLSRDITRELPSEPVLPGAVQVPSDGRPIVFGPDAPVTGGYPVIAVVRSSDLDLAAQLRPGDTVELRRLR